MLPSKEESYGDREAFHYEEEDLKEMQGQLPVWNILPSYEMYSESYYGTRGPEPPDYDLEPASTVEAPSLCDNTTNGETQPIASSGPDSYANSYTYANSNFTPFTTDSSHSHLHGAAPSDEAVMFDDANDSWQDCVLDNIHKLNNMTHTDNVYAQGIKTKVFFTKDVYKYGEDPEIIDPSKFEYKQGDYINGFMTIENTTDFAISFKMFYLMFEGTISIPGLKKNFLQMFDFYGSFFKNRMVARLVTEYSDTSVCPLSVDRDGSHMGFRTNKLEPKTIYKRLFSFKIPEYLLDNECPSYTLSTHVRLPPSMGDTRDFSLLDSKIEYNVRCRFIGKANTYAYNPNKDNALVFNARGDEYVILKETDAPIRIIEQSPTATPSLDLYQDLLFENMVKNVDEKIDLARKLRDIELKKGSQALACVEEVIESLEQTAIESNSAKLKQLYVRSKDCKRATARQIHVTTRPGISLLKKHGPLHASTPYKVYEVPYVSPKIHRTSPFLPNLNISIPFKFSTQSATAPTLKRVYADLVCLTVQSGTPIPIEFNHGMVFKNNKPDDTLFTTTDDFKHNVVQFFAEKYGEIKNLCKTVNIENLRLEKKLLSDLKCLASLKLKTINLTVHEPKVHEGTLQVNSPTWNRIDSTLVSQFNLNLDLQNLSTKGERLKDPFDVFTLVPDFQSCHISRIYYLKVYFQFSNHNVLVKVPLSIVR